VVAFFNFRDKVRKSLILFERRSYVKEELPESNLIDCSLGQNPFGFPKELLKEIDLGAIGIGGYPDPYHLRLRKALVERWGGLFKEDDVFIGAGSMGCLEKINKALMREGVTVLGYLPQFTEYISEVEALGGVYDSIMLDESDGFRFNSEKLLSKLSKEHILVYIDNPNNPTGQVIPIDEIRLIVERAMRLDVVVIVDEAYGDFMDDENSALTLNYPNLIVIRSFSKGFGLAGLRVGYAVIKGEEVKEFYRKVNLPFEVSSISEEIAIKALKYKSFVEESRVLIRKIKEEMIASLQRKGFCLSYTHLDVPIFLLWQKGINLYDYFRERGILCVKGCDFLGLNSSFVRVRVPPQIESFLERVGFGF